MKLPRRNFLLLAAGAAALPAISRAARAQAYPARSLQARLSQCPLRSESDQSAALPRSDAMVPKAVTSLVGHILRSEFSTNQFDGRDAAGGYVLDHISHIVRCVPAHQ